MAKKKLYGAAAKAHAKKMGRKKNPKRRRKAAPNPSPKRRRRSSAKRRTRKTTSIVVRTPNPMKHHRRARRRRSNPGSGSIATGGVTKIKTWEKVGMQAAEAVGGGIAGGMAAAAVESRLAQSQVTIGLAEIALGAIGILVGYKAGYPSVGLGFGAVAGSMGAKNILAGAKAPAAAASSATAPAADAGTGAAGDGSGGAPMGALTMGALVDDNGNPIGSDMNGYEGVLSAVQDASGEGPDGRPQYADPDDYQESAETW